MAVPAPTPVITPPGVVVAIARSLLIQPPPVVVLLSVVVFPWQSAVVPVMAAGTALTVTVKVPRPVPVE